MKHSTKPKLAFIIPAYNAAATLNDTLASVKAQSIREWESIVVDDGSSDATADLASATGDPRIKVVRQENRGLAGARNTGLRHAVAESVCFLDADDTVAPTYAAKMLGALEQADAAACAYEMVRQDLSSMGWVTRPGLDDTRLERLVETNPFAVTTVVRTAALHQYAALPNGRTLDVFDESLPVLEDWDLWLRATAAGLRWAIVDEPLFNYRLVPGLSRNIEVMWKTGLRVIGSAPVEASLKPRALRRWTLRNAARAIANDDPATGVRMLGHIAGVGSGAELGDEDLTTFAETLSPAFQRATLTSPADAAARRERWRFQVQCALLDQPSAKALLARFDDLFTDWAGVAREVASQLAAADIPTIYGMGWNGRALIVELSRLLPGRELAWLDDEPSAAAPSTVLATRVQVSHLTPRHAVIVTPNARSGILKQLRGVRVAWPRVREAA